PADRPARGAPGVRHRRRRDLRCRDPARLPRPAALGPPPRARRRPPDLDRAHPRPAFPGCPGLTGTTIPPTFVPQPRQRGRPPACRTPPRRGAEPPSLSPAPRPGPASVESVPESTPPGPFVGRPAPTRPRSRPVPAPARGPRGPGAAVEGPPPDPHR